MFFNFRYFILLLQWSLNVTKGHGTGKMCSCPFPLWFYYYWGKENRSGYSEDYVILRFHCSTIRCVGSNYFWLVNYKFPYPFKYFNTRSPYTSYTQCLKKVPLSLGGGGAPRMGHHRELTLEHSFLVEQIWKRKFVRWWHLLHHLCCLYRTRTLSVLVCHSCNTSLHVQTNHEPTKMSLPVFTRKLTKGKFAPSYQK